jgi:hypothetical protein
VTRCTFSFISLYFVFRGLSSFDSVFVFCLWFILRSGIFCVITFLCFIALRGFLFCFLINLFISISVLFFCLFLTILLFLKLILLFFS